MFCPPVSYAFATSAYRPIAIAPSSCSAAAPICRPSPRHCSTPHRLLIVVNTATAAPCVGLRFFLPANFPLGCPTHLSPRLFMTIDSQPGRTKPLPHSRWGKARTVATPSIHCAILSPMLLPLPYSKDPYSLFRLVNYLRLRRSGAGDSAR